MSFITVRIPLGKIRHLEKNVKQKIRSQLFEILGYVVVVFVFILFNLYLAVKISNVHVDLTIESAENGNFQIYWRQKNKPYKEKDSVVVKITPDQNNYSFMIPSFANFNLLRIDPINKKEPVSLKSLILKHKLFNTVPLFPQEKEIVMMNQNQLKIIKQSKENGIYIVPEDIDPFFEIAVSSSLQTYVIYMFLIMTFAGTFLLYILFNQSLLKGKRQSATLLVTFPENEKSSRSQIFKIVRKHCSAGKLRSIQSYGKSVKFIFDFPKLTEQNLTGIIKEVKELSHLNQCHVQYNRSGEV